MAFASWSVCRGEQQIVMKNDSPAGTQSGGACGKRDLFGGSCASVAGGWELFTLRTTAR